MTAGLVVSLSWFDFLLSGLLPGCLLLIRVAGLSLLKFGGSGRFYDDRLQFMLVTFLRLGLSGLVLLRLLLQMPIVFLVVLPLVMVWFLGRGMARLRRVRLGGHKVRKVRCNAVDVRDAADCLLVS